MTTDQIIDHALANSWTATHAIGSKLQITLHAFLTDGQTRRDVPAGRDWIINGKHVDETAVRDLIG